MKTKEITIYGQPFIVGLGDHICGRGHFIVFPYGRNVRADYIKGGRFSDTLKFVQADVVRTEIDTDELLPLHEYFVPGTQNFKAGLSEKVITEFENVSRNSPETGPRYSHYYQLPPLGNSGPNLYANALGLHIYLHHGGVWVFNTAGEIIQPVTFNLEFLPRETSVPYSLAVTPVDGLAPFEFSADGENWQSQPELVYLDPENKSIYVRDQAGTTSSRSIKAADWNAAILP